MKIARKFLIQQLCQRERNDFDNVIAITGGEGTGKSTLAYILGYEFSREMGVIFQLKKNIIIAPTEDQIIEMVRNLPRYAVIDLDEAIRVLYKMDWNTAEQRLLNKLYTVCRDENKTTILCMPRFTDFGEFWRNHRIKIWLHILERGLAVVFIRDEGIVGTDVWNLKKLEDERNIPTINGKLKYYRKINTFYGYFRFPQLSKTTYARYKEHKAAEKYKDMQKTAEAPRKEKYYEKIQKEREISAVRLLMAETSLSSKEIASKLGISMVDFYARYAGLRTSLGQVHKAEIPKLDNEPKYDRIISTIEDKSELLYHKSNENNKVKGE